MTQRAPAERPHDVVTPRCQERTLVSRGNYRTSDGRSIVEMRDEVQCILSAEEPHKKHRTDGGTRWQT